MLVEISEDESLLNRVFNDAKKRLYNQRFEFL